MMTALWRALIPALALLTTLPVPRQHDPDPDAISRAPLTYPLVGLLLGIVMISASWVLFNWPPLAAAAIVLALWTLLTGALHLDGLADCADGLLGGHGNPNRRRQIMHDPHVGSAAVVAVALVLLGKFAGLAAVLDHGNLTPLLLAPVIGRGAVLALMCAVPCAKPGGMAQAITAHLPRQAAWLVVAVVCVLALILAPAALLIAAPLTWLIGRGALRRLGGASGDVYGATIELIETAVLLAMALPTGE